MTSKKDDGKKEIRARLLKDRDSLRIDTLDAVARSICKRLEVYEKFRDAGRIGAYYSIGSEVPTGGIISHVLQSGRELYLPRVTGDSIMEFCRVRSLSELVPGVLGRIMEPGPLLAETSTDMDVIIVPAVAASHDGHRLGYGRGYYDRYLKGQSGAEIIVILPESQIVRRLPVEGHDVAADAIITEKRVIIPSRRR